MPDRLERIRQRFYVPKPHPRSPLSDEDIDYLLRRLEAAEAVIEAVNGPGSQEEWAMRSARAMSAWRQTSDTL